MSILSLEEGPGELMIGYQACIKRKLHIRYLHSSIGGINNREDYLVLPIKSEPHLLSDTSDEDTPRKRRRIDQGDSLPDLEMWGDIELEDVPRLCIERPSPLVCVNQDLASRLF
jgi:hypothetical protein